MNPERLREGRVVEYDDTRNIAQNKDCRASEELIETFYSDPIDRKNWIKPSTKCEYTLQEDSIGRTRAYCPTLPMIPRC